MRRTMTRLAAFLKAICCTGLVVASTCAAEPISASGASVDFDRDIRPIFATHCIACHGGVKREGGVSFIDREAVISGAAAVVAGQPDESELVHRVASEDDAYRMPPDGTRLTAEQIAKLRQWIAEGALWPRHWSFEPIDGRLPPNLPSLGTTRNAIDLFVLHRLEANGIDPSPPADPRTLVRRLYLDLLGLPPTPAEVSAYVSDTRPDAYDRLVDRLLASPHFGERWGRHWLDLARYADTDGYEVDKERPHAWYWRDWVIDSINADQPFDQFTIEQLAGDLLPAATAEQLLATAFHRQTLTNKEGGIDEEEYRVYAVMDRVATTATVWLGLTVGCTQCHDHPYDPISQEEYYGLFAFFNNADEIESKHASADGDLELSILKERDEPRTTYLLRRGDFLAPDSEQPVEPHVLSTLHALDPAHGGRLNRLDLARWIIEPDNPLTARVAANDLWMRLFGEGLVRTPEDFGASGERPRHRQLLDWLARAYCDSGWSRKSLIRTIVLSSTYRQSSRFRPELEQIDPRNELLHRQNRIRLEAEIVRDAHLSVGGLLSRRIGGPSVFPPFPEDLKKIDFRSDLNWQASQGEDRYRRGMYTFFKRTLPHPNQTVFDCPDANATAVSRQSSNTPLQALTTLNNIVFLEAARALGNHLAAEAGSGAGGAIESAYQICLARAPAAAERKRLLGLFASSHEYFRQHPQEAREWLGEDQQTNENALSERAAWSVVANTVLNLDEFITRE